VPRLLAASDALIAPTRYEAYGLAVHEALCCGLPAFVTRTAGVAEQYPSSLEQLLIKDPDDDLDLAERLRSWRLGPERYRAQMTTLAARLRQHTWNEMAAEIIGLIENRT
jgi:glycosyltransferase involved in cell wall biosynthesis